MEAKELLWKTDGNDLLFEVDKNKGFAHEYDAIKCNVIHNGSRKKANQNGLSTYSLSKTAESQNSIVHGRKGKSNFTDLTDEELTSKPLPYSPPLCSRANGINNYPPMPMPALIALQNDHHLLMGNGIQDVFQAAVEEMSADNLEQLQSAANSLPQAVVRCSVKLFDATPDQLPQDVQEALFSMLDVEPEFMQFNVRSGCVHITIDAAITERVATKLTSSFHQKVRDNLHKILAGKEPTGVVLTQCGSHLSVHELDIVPGGHPKNSLQVVLQEKHKKPPVIPTPQLLFPLATFLAPEKGVKTCITLVGMDLMRKQSRVICRHGITTPVVTVIRHGPVSRLKEAGFPLDGETKNLDYLQCTMTDLQPGLHFVEMEFGGMLSKPTAFIVCQDKQLVAEVRQLERAEKKDMEKVSNIVIALGVIMESFKEGQEKPSEPKAESSLPYKTNLVEAQKSHLSDLAQSLAAIAAVRGWPAMLKLVLPAIHPSVAASIITATGMDGDGSESFGGGGGGGADLVDLLYLATLSRRKEVVNILQSWAEDLGLSWELRHLNCSKGSTVHLTPLHLSVLIDDQAGMAQALTRAYGKHGRTFWSESVCLEQPEDSKQLRRMMETTPMMLAQYVGNTDVWNYLHQIYAVAGPSVTRSDEILVMQAVNAGMGAEKDKGSDGDNDADGESWQHRIRSELETLELGNVQDATIESFFERRGVLLGVIGLLIGMIVRWLIEIGIFT